MTEPLAESARRWSQLPPSMAADAARQDQEARWQRGERPAIEDYFAALPRVAASPEDALLLVYGEVVCREALGETVNVAAYLQRFGGYADQLAAVFAVHDGISAGDLIEPPTPNGMASGPPTVAGLRDFTFVARGGMGTVYRAVHDDTGLPVAVKIVSDTFAGPEMLVRFLQESEILHRLVHPNIAAFVAAGNDRGRPYLLMEWIDGGTLAQRIARRPPTITETVRLVATVAGAVAHAHAKGIVHRDLKPANVLLTGSGVPKLTDFGVARWSGVGGTCTATGQVLGSVRYMSPEQVRGKPDEIGPWTDVYGLGTILYECLTGRPPFEGSHRMDLIARIAHREPVPPEELNPLLPDDVLALTRRCLAKRPADRWRSAAELAGALTAIASGLSAIDDALN